MVNNLVIFHQNIRSLRANFDIFVAELMTHNLSPDIIILTEVWVNSNEIKFYNLLQYNVFFKCNERHRAGGVVVYVKKSITNVVYFELQCQSADLMLISLELFGQQFSILAIYRLQFFTADVFVRELSSLFRSANNNLRNIKNLLWIGDVNINILDVNDFNQATDEYNALMAINGLECVLNEPTRITEHSKTCIDHVFARLSDKSIATVEATVKQLDITDHSLVQVIVRVLVGGGGSRTRDLPPSPSTVRYRTDYTKLDQLTDNVDWSSVYTQPDASSAFDDFFEILQNCLMESRVEIQERCTMYKKLKPWVNDYICMKIKRRNHLFKLLKTHTSNENLKQYYRVFRNKLNHDIKT